MIASTLPVSVQAKDLRDEDPDHGLSNAVDWLLSLGWDGADIVDCLRCDRKDVARGRDRASKRHERELARHAETDTLDNTACVA